MAGAVLSVIASVCGAIDWDDPAGVLGPNIILDGSRSEEKLLPALFQ
jgi:hypothetical protein